jgi:acylphosphatase
MSASFSSATSLPSLSDDRPWEIPPRPQNCGWRRRAGGRCAALRLDVSGWVRNRSDGAVEAVVRGPPAAVEALIAEMRQGPPFAVVKRLTVTEPDFALDGEEGTFHVLSAK